MKWILISLAFIIVSSLESVTIKVNLAGGGNFTNIQPAIDSCVSGDTILVYPGTYYENIDFSGKNISIASLELTTGNPAYRDSTIIDGNNNGSCVKVLSPKCWCKFQLIVSLVV